MKYLKAAWNWIKRNWKWILFPVGLVSLLVSALVGAKAFHDANPDREDLDTIDEDLERAAEEAMRERDKKLVELAEKHKSRLDTLSSEQERELEELTERPIDEVVMWFDQL